MFSILSDSFTHWLTLATFLFAAVAGDVGACDYIIIYILNVHLYMCERNTNIITSY